VCVSVCMCARMCVHVFVRVCACTCVCMCMCVWAHRARRGDQVSKNDRMHVHDRHKVHASTAREWKRVLSTRVHHITLYTRAPHNSLHGCST